MGKLAYQLLGVGGSALAALAARKALTVVWEKTMDRPTPSQDSDDDSTLAEALAWTIVSGVGIAVAQLVVQRYAIKAVRNTFGEEALPKKMRKKNEEEAHA